MMSGSTGMGLHLDVYGGDDRLFDTLPPSSVLEEKANRPVSRYRPDGRRDPFRSLLNRSARGPSTEPHPQETTGPPTQRWTVLGIMGTVDGRRLAVVHLGNAPPVILSVGERVGSAPWIVKEIAQAALVLEGSEGNRVTLPVGKPTALVP
ncbi:MAG: hypothetical protein D6690_14840 [Nitrospirae bacterium]|nr:MAG: hypothetical protein D6690_14840 [Nitrospirota bacterium]